MPETQPTQTNQQDQIDIDIQILPENAPIPNTQPQTDINDEDIYIRNELNKQYSYWTQIEATERPRIPKPRFNNQFLKPLKTINNILPTLIQESHTLEQIHTIIYSAAYTSITLNRQNARTQNTKVGN